ncbi:Mitochondrial ATPase complex subunit atp10 [Lobulomyces angularis]|nr:Mitochondrial ATPase complex subunit atp10 [Lobulomyces angularis]
MQNRTLIRLLSSKTNSKSYLPPALDFETTFNTNINKSSEKKVSKEKNSTTKKNNDTPPKKKDDDEKNLNFFQRFDKRLKDKAAEIRSQQGQRPTGYLYRLEDRLKEQSSKKLAESKDKRKMELKARMDKFFDDDAIKMQREVLLKKAFTKGYFADAKEVAVKGDKFWEAPKVLNSLPTAKQMIKLDCITLAKNKVELSALAKGKVSLVTFFFNAFGEPHVKSYVDPFLEKYEKHTDTQLIQVHVEETWTKVPFLKMLLPLVRKKIPVNRHDNYLLNYEDIEEIRSPIGLTNKLLGWVNLVDSRGFIRWQAHGPATKGEIESLLKNVELLLNDKKASLKIK